MVHGLKPLGRALAVKVQPVAEWVEANVGEVVAAREEFDRTTA